MAKKRKAVGRTLQSESDADQEPRPSESKLQISTYQDVANSEDEFNINQDKVLLDEGRAQKRQRRTREEGISCVNDSLARAYRE